MLDFLGDSFIPRVDFKLVLQEFGIRCQAIDLENFFAKYVTSGASPPASGRVTGGGVIGVRLSWLSHVY